MSKNDYARFRSTIHKKYQTESNTIILGATSEGELVSVLLEPGGSLTVQTGPRTGSSYLPRTIMVAHMEHTTETMCIISQTDYSSLSTGPQCLFIDAGRNNASKKIREAFEGGYDLMIVDGISKMPSSLREQTLSHLRDYKGKVIDMDEVHSSSPDVKFMKPMQEGQRGYATMWGASDSKDFLYEFRPLYVPLGEQLPNYMSESAAARERNAFEAYNLSKTFRYEDYADEFGVPSGCPNLKFGIGIDRNGETVSFDMREDANNLVIGGVPGSGKSMLIRNIMMNLMRTNDPEDIDILLFETDRGLEEFAKYPHVKAMVASESSDTQKFGLYERIHQGYVWLLSEAKRRDKVFFGRDTGAARMGNFISLRNHYEKTGDASLKLSNIVLILNDAGDCFTHEAQGEQLQIRNEIREMAEELLNYRHTGISAIYVTQEIQGTMPMPKRIFLSSAKIGLTANDPETSRRIWGDTSLSKLGKAGRGKLIAQDGSIPENPVEQHDFRSCYIPMGELISKTEKTPNLFDRYLSDLTLRSQPLAGWETGMQRVGSDIEGGEESYRPRIRQIDMLTLWGSVTPESRTLLEACMKGSLNTVVSGTTGAGKTMMLEALMELIPPANVSASPDRTVIIEDAAELEFDYPHVSYEAEPPSEETSGRTVEWLLRAALPLRPSRIIVGECRGDEALPILEAMNVGYSVMTTIHATEAGEALTRLNNLASVANRPQSEDGLFILLSSIDLIVHVDKMPVSDRPGYRKRMVSQISEVRYIEGEAATVDIFKAKEIDGEWKLLPTGERPLFVDTKLVNRGITLPDDLFQS